MADDKEKKDEKEEGIQIGEATVKTVLSVSNVIRRQEQERREEGRKRKANEETCILCKRTGHPSSECKQPEGTAKERQDSLRKAGVCLRCLTADCIQHPASQRLGCCHKHWKRVCGQIECIRDAVVHSALVCQRAETAERVRALPTSSFSLDTSMSTSMSPLPKKKQH